MDKEKDQELIDCAAESIRVQHEALAHEQTLIYSTWVPELMPLRDEVVEFVFQKNIYRHAASISFRGEPFYLDELPGPALPANVALKKVQTELFEGLEEFTREAASDIMFVHLSEKAVQDVSTIIGESICDCLSLALRKESAAAPPPPPPPPTLPDIPPPPPVIPRSLPPLPDIPPPPAIPRALPPLPDIPSPPAIPRPILPPPPQTDIRKRPRAPFGSDVQIFLNDALKAIKEIVLNEPRTHPDEVWPCNPDDKVMTVMQLDHHRQLGADADLVKPKKRGIYGFDQAYAVSIHGTEIVAAMFGVTGSEVWFRDPRDCVRAGKKIMALLDEFLDKKVRL